MGMITTVDQPAPWRKNQLTPVETATKYGIDATLFARLYLFEPGANPAGGPYVDASPNLTNGTKYAGVVPTAEGWGLQVLDSAGLAITTGLAWPLSGTAFIAMRSTTAKNVGHHSYWLHRNGANAGGVTAPTYTTTTPFLNGGVSEESNTHAIAGGGSVDYPNRKVLHPGEAAPSQQDEVLCFRWNNASGLAELFNLRAYVSHSAGAGHWSAVNALGPELTFGPRPSVGSGGPGNIYAFAIATSVLTNVQCRQTMRAIAKFKADSQGLRVNGYSPGFGLTG
ncbi:MAG TPA: hypothetical protein VGX71_27570 [Pseudaminobacter sp.]|nr:hypothetical protein [Pseudaminobacter sp.]